MPRRSAHPRTVRSSIPSVVWKVAVDTSPEAEEAVTELIQEILDHPASSYTDVETNDTTVESYLVEKPDWKATREAIQSGLARIRSCGLRVGSAKVALSAVRRRDWVKSWKRHFKPISIGSRLLIKPSWSKRRATRGQSVVVLDPGLSFGTGQHPTTSFCLQEIVRHAKSGSSFLDIGTGSGILAISAAKLGYKEVQAFDFDEEAVRMARGNARRNRVLERLHIFPADLTKLPRRTAKQYHVVCANLISTLLLSERLRVAARVQPGGVLILAGVLASEFQQVEWAYRQLGFEPLASRTENEWRSGSFRCARSRR